RGPVLGHAPACAVPHIPLVLVRGRAAGGRGAEGDRRARGLRGAAVSTETRHGCLRNREEDVPVGAGRGESVGEIDGIAASPYPDLEAVVGVALALRPALPISRGPVLGHAPACAVPHIPLVLIRGRAAGGRSAEGDG